MAELTDAQIDAALERGKMARLNEPRASAARYGRRRGRIVVELTNGCAFAFPPRLAPGLETADEDQLAQVEILGTGHGLHWDALDTDLSVPGLLVGMFGTKAFMPGMPDARRPRPRPRQQGQTAPKAAARARRPAGNTHRTVLTVGGAGEPAAECQGAM